MGALEGSLMGITVGLESDVDFPQLLGKLDAIHGIDNAKDDAKARLSSCKKKENPYESIAMFAERVRQLCNRAYPEYSDMGKDEQALRAFLLGLPTKHDFRLKM